MAFPAANEFYRQALARCEGDAAKGGDEIAAILSAMGTDENRLLALQKAMAKRAFTDLSKYANASRCLDIGAEFGGRIVTEYLVPQGLCVTGILLAVAAGVLALGLPHLTEALPEEDRIEAAERVSEAFLRRLLGE